MGIDYIYVNHSKKQYFDIGLFGESCRFRHAGFSYGSRALSLLISHQGSWNSDSIEMVDDVSERSLFLSSEYINISVEAELLILDVDGVKYFDNENELDFNTFSFLCLYATILRRKEIIGLLDRKYGPGIWQKQYKAHYRDQNIGWENAIYAAQSRSMILYNK